MLIKDNKNPTALSANSMPVFAVVMPVKTRNINSKSEREGGRERIPL